MKNAKIVVYTLLYFVTSLSLGFLSSYFLDEKSYNFPYPLFTSGSQNMVHFLLATLLLSIKKAQPPRLLNLMAFPCVITASIDIGISSYALRHVSLAFYTMVKSSAPMFILLCGFAFGIEKLSLLLFLVMLTIGSGVFLTSMVDTNFNMYGFGLVSVASFMAGFRWAFVQYLIHKRRARRTNVVVTVQELCLPISIILLCSSSIAEGIVNIVKREFMANKRKALLNTGFILFGGCLSFVLLLAEFALVGHTSVVYLSMCGIVKEIMIVVYSVMRKKIKLGRINVVGLVISMAGIVLFNLTSRRSMRKEEEKAQIAAQHEEL